MFRKLLIAALLAAGTSWRHGLPRLGLQRSRVALFSSGSSDDVSEQEQRRGPDPLDGVVSGPLSPKSKPTITAGPTTPPTQQPRASLPAAAAADDNGGVVVPFDEALVRERAAVLRLLPLEFIMAFRDVAEQLLPRVALFTVTVYMMLLIPILRIVKLSLHGSIYPYLYIGPALLLVPYLAFWLWETDVTPVPFVDDRLAGLMRAQQLASVRRLDKGGREALAKEAAGGGPDAAEALRRLAGLSVFSELDLDNFFGEVLAVKKRLKGVTGRIPLSTFIAATDGAVSASTTTSSSSSGAAAFRWNDDDNGRDERDRGKPATAVDAARAVLDAAFLEGRGSDEELMGRLKQLQKDLDDAGKGTRSGSSDDAAGDGQA